MIRFVDTDMVEAIRGFSNRVGVSVTGAAEIMKMLGATNALMIDNGGDVMMSFQGKTILPSPDGQREKLRSVLVYRMTEPDSQLKPGDMRLVSYPKQYSFEPR